MKQKAMTRKGPDKAAGDPSLQVAYRIDALLHTMRAIERHEEQLCTLMHEIRGSGSIESPLYEELRELLDDLPAEAYQADLDAVRNAMDVTPPAHTHDAKKAAKPAARGRRSGRS